MNQTFRPRKSLKPMFIGLAAFYLLALIGSSCNFFLEDPAKHGFIGPNSVAAVGGMALAVFGTLFLISVYCVVEFYCESFTINGTALTIRTFRRLQHFDLSNLRRLEWRIRPVAGSILFHLPDLKAQQQLYNYSHEDRLKIIRALHSMVPDEQQEGWSRFCYKIALPLRDGISAYARTQPPSALLTITRSRYDRMFLIVCPISIALAIAFGVCANIWQPAVMPFQITMGWLILRFSVPPGGQREVRLTSTSGGRSQLIGFGLLLAAMLLMAALPILGIEKETACGIAAFVLLPAFPLLIYSAYKDQKLMDASEHAGRELAVVEWQRSQDANETDDDPFLGKSKC